VKDEFEIRIHDDASHRFIEVPLRNITIVICDDTACATLHKWCQLHRALHIQLSQTFVSDDAAASAMQLVHRRDQRQQAATTFRHLAADAKSATILLIENHICAMFTRDHWVLRRR
jgi:hypothetical protein